MTIIGKNLIKNDAMLSAFHPVILSLFVKYMRMDGDELLTACRKAAGHMEPDLYVTKVRMMPINIHITHIAANPVKG